MATLTCHRLGRVEYRDGLELQQQFQTARRSNAVTDTLLLLEHPAVLTLGRAANRTNVLATDDALTSLGVELFDTDRGGDVTYHGPGQLVGYPLLHLGPDHQDVRKYVRNLEEVILRTLSDFGIAATRIEKWPGVWVESSRLGGPRKICALGVHLSRWYTKHGFALNIEPDLSHFELIVPCGITEAGVTSMAKELPGGAPSMAEVETRLLVHFGAVFECELLFAPPPVDTVSVVVVSARRDEVLLLRRTPARGGFWQPITGAVQAGERVDQAARRELREEAGLDVTVQPLGVPHAFALGELVERPKLVREHPFLAVAPSPSIQRSAEHDLEAWVDRDEALLRLPFDGLKRSIREALR